MADVMERADMRMVEGGDARLPQPREPIAEDLCLDDALAATLMASMRSSRVSRAR